MELNKRIKKQLVVVKDWPRHGVKFYDLNTVISDMESFNAIAHELCEHSQFKDVKIAGVEARGFIWASAVASKLGACVVPIRKMGKIADSQVDGYTNVKTEYGPPPRP